MARHGSGGCVTAGCGSRLASRSTGLPATVQAITLHQYENLYRIRSTPFTTGEDSYLCSPTHDTKLCDLRYRRQQVLHAPQPPLSSGNDRSRRAEMKRLSSGPSSRRLNYSIKSAYCPRSSDSICTTCCHTGNANCRTSGHPKQTLQIL